MLCADGSFPYSDKDIELVCGSLVHIRNGTLQVVHLTVKEYIQSCSGTDSSALLIEVGNASSRLAIVCLSFLGFNCTQPITNFETSKIDIQQLCAKTPFIEYAVTFWMFHLVRCEGKDSLEVFKQFKRTFNSSSTFCWMEMYLALHPSNVPDLLLFLDEIGNLGSSLGEISLPLEDSSFSFMAGWCAAIKRVLKEYGSALVLQPFQIHHLNLASTFSTGMLAEMYDNFGNVNAREKSSRFEINQHLRKPSKEVPPYRRLQGDIGGFEKGVGLFLYDSRREVYIWSPDRLSDTCEFVLFVQSATHGKQLRPVKCHVDGEANDSKLLREPAHSMSKDGTVLLIILYTSEGEALTLVWQIEEYLDFSKGLHAPPWACLRFRFSSKHVRNFGRLWFHPMCLAFRVDGGFCTPAGLLDSAFKTVSPTWADILQPLLNPRIDVVFYSGNGEFLFIHKNSVSPPVIEKLTWPHLEEVATFRLWDMARAALRSSPNPTLANSDDSSYIDVIAVSPSGRYLALQCTVPPQPDYAVLLDTVSRKAVEMGWEPSGASSFHFSNDETEINIFVPPHWNPPVKLIKYAGLPDHGFLKSEREFSLPLTLSSPINRWYVSNDHRLAIVATPSGVIQRIKFSHKLELLDTPKTIDHEMAGFVVIGVFVSQDGDQFAHLHEKGKNLCLQVREVANVGSILRNLEFGVEKPSSVLPITMSPDLSILVIGQKIYKIGLLDDQITSEPVQISDIPVDDDCKVIVSSSNIFIACVPKKDFLKLPIPVTAFRVFRLDVEGTSLVPMRSLLPGVAEIMSVEFHSSLPRMAIVYILESELSAFKATSTLSKNDHQARNQVVTYSQVAIIDLNTANIRHVQILGDPTLQLVRRLESNKVDIFHHVKSLTFW